MLSIPLTKIIGFWGRNEIKFEPYISGRLQYDGSTNLDNPSLHNLSPDPRYAPPAACFGLSESIDEVFARTTSYCVHRINGHGVDHVPWEKPFNFDVIAYSERGRLRKINEEGCDVITKC